MSTLTPRLHHIANRTKTLPPLRVGIGGPVGSGKTTLLEMLCKAMREQYDLVAITNDIYTKEDQRLLTIRMRTTPKGLKPFVMTNLKTLSGLTEVVRFIETKGMLQSA